MEEKERKFDDEYWFSFRILSHSPLVTFSTMDHQNAYIDKLASAVPRAFSAKNAIHFIKTTWNFETHGVLRLVEAIKKQQRSLPDHRFIILANYDYEAFLMAGAGLEVIVANDGLFSDETLWTISQNGLEGFGQYDAVYNGRFSRVKRHELAVAVKSLLLIYGHAIDEGDDTAFERVSALLPNAVFANHQIGTGHYTNLEHRLVALLYRHASIGLCLSAQEGAMRVSSEYMLCGLPVVSTHSVGGRDRYYCFPFTKVVADNPDIIAHAVAELVSANLDRERIRHEFAQVLGFDRYNFLDAINKVCRQSFGADKLFPVFAPFLGAMQHFGRMSETIGNLRNTNAQHDLNDGTNDHDA